MEIKEYTSAKTEDFERDFLNGENLKQKINILYKVPFVNTATFVNRYLDNYCNKIVEALNDYDPQKRQDNECEYEHDANCINFYTNRKEEVVCKLLCKNNPKKFIDYQVPLKPSSKNMNDLDNKGYGKIDVLYKEKNTVLRIIELKKYASDEKIVRAMLECCTYYKQVNKNMLFKKQI